MKIIISLLCIFLYGFAWTQQPITITANQIGSGATIYITNSAYCPMTVSVQFTLENMNFKTKQKSYTDGEHTFFIIPARAEKFKFGQLENVDFRQAWKYSWSYRSYYGDVTVNHYDSMYAYCLPYEKNKFFKVIHGYNPGAHQYAFDFEMPEGTPVLAARDGVVIRVEQSNNISCAVDTCRRYTNAVMIYHNDGTMASYEHLKYNGAVVKPGDKVKKGDLIAYSGNTGYSSSPRLYFDCCLPSPSPSTRRTLPTLFAVDTSNTAMYLQQGNTYVRKY